MISTCLLINKYLVKYLLSLSGSVQSILSCLCSCWTGSNVWTLWNQKTDLFRSSLCSWFLNEITDSFHQHLNSNLFSSWKEASVAILFFSQNFPCVSLFLLFSDSFRSATIKNCLYDACTLQIQLMNLNCRTFHPLLTKSHSGDASTTIFGPVNLVCVDGDPDSSSGITENLPRCKNGDPCGINRKRPTEVGSGGGATVTLKRPRDSASDSIFLLKFSSNTSEKFNSWKMEMRIFYF